VLSVSGPTSATPSTTGNTHGVIKIGVRGWGSVVLGRGFVDKYHAVKCLQESWCVASRFASSGLAVAKAYPRKGWKFVRWTGACMGKKPKCTVSLEHARTDRLGYRHARLAATFVAAVPGFTRSWPVPFGHFGSTDPGNGYRLRVNSVTANASLSPAAPAGTHYFVANITVTHRDGTSSDSVVSLANFALSLISSTSYIPYTLSGGPCPNDGPAPQLNTLGGLESGLSAITGNVCWTVPAHNTSSLVLAHDGHTYKTWFALH
jgi:hypothetical protein